MALEGTVRLPGGATVSKKSLALAVGAFVVIGGVIYIRRRGAGADSTAVIDPSAVDPATGYAYGSPEDAQALAGQSAYQNPVDYGGGGGPATSGTTVNPLATNAQWFQAAVAYLTDQGASSANVRDALGKYLAGDSVTTEEKALINQAIGAFGVPPQSGTTGYPPSIRVANVAPAKTRLTAPAIRVVSKTPNQADLQWANVEDATGYALHRDGKYLRTVDHSKATVGRPGQYYVTARAAGFYESKPSNFLQV